MRVLAACEFSGVVRDAFLKLGHDAYSADWLPTERGPKKRHFEGDIRDTLRWEAPFDLIIAFPPCTHLAVSGARWFKDKQREQFEAVEFARWLINYEYADKVCVENPIGTEAKEFISRWLKADANTSICDLRPTLLRNGIAQS